MQIRLNSTLRGRTGRHSIELDLPAGTTVRQALAALISRVPELRSLLLDGGGDLSPHIVIFRSGRNIDFYDGLDTPLLPEQALDLFPRTGVQRAWVRE